MLQTITYLKNNLADHFLIYFIPLYVVGGRPAAILGAQFLGFKIVFLLPVVVMLDTLQIPIFYHIYRRVSRIALVQKFRERISKKEKHLRSSRFFHWMHVMGMPGVVAITMTPLKGCGMWSGVLLSEILGLPKRKSYPLLIFGSIFGCSLIFIVGEAGLKIAGLF